VRRVPLGARFRFALLVLAALAVGCGGGGGGGGTGVGNPPPTSGPTSAPTATPSPTAPPTTAPGFSSTVTQAYTGSAETVFLGGTFGSSVVPNASGAVGGGTTVTVVTSYSPITGFRALQSVRRASSWTGLNPVVYLTMTFSANVTLTALPGFSLTLPAAPTAPLFLAYDDGSGWHMNVAGQGVVSSGASTYNVQFPSVGGTFAFASGVPYDFVVYGDPSAPASPTPSPTPSPSPTPTPPASPTPTPTPSPTPPPSPTPSPTPVPVAGKLVISPSALDVSPSGSASFLIQDYLADGSPYTGTFTKTQDTCSSGGYATTDFDPSSTGPAVSVKVTGGNVGGSCTITFTDHRDGSANQGPPQSAFVNVNNHAGGISIGGRRRSTP
jgi:hypothetical protein